MRGKALPQPLLPWAKMRCARKGWQQPARVGLVGPRWGSEALAGFHVLGARAMYSKPLEGCVCVCVCAKTMVLEGKSRERSGMSLECTQPSTTKGEAAAAAAVEAAMLAYGC